MNLSVIMPVYNESLDEVNISINSILRQTYKYFNLIIIDDNPKYYRMKQFLRGKASSDSRIRLLFNSKSIGPALSRNKGILHTNSNLIAIMDADDISSKIRFISQIKFMKRYNLDFVFSNCINFDENGMHKENVAINNKIIDQRILRYLFSHYYDCAIHSSWMLKRSIYVKLHGYRNLQHGEDFDFIIRSLIYNYKVGFQPKNLVYKRKRFNGVSSSNQLEQFNISLLLKKYARDYNYNYIIPLKVIYMDQNKLSSESIKKFNWFLKCGHFVKHNFNLKDFFKFIFLTLTSLNSLKYLLEIIFHKICLNKINKAIIKDRG